MLYEVITAELLRQRRDQLVLPVRLATVADEAPEANGPGLGELHDALADIVGRITSYNVCYTKLLRLPPRAPRRGTLPYGCPRSSAWKRRKPLARSRPVCLPRPLLPSPSPGPPYSGRGTSARFRRSFRKGRSTPRQSPLARTGGSYNFV